MKDVEPARPVAVMPDPEHHGCAILFPPDTPALNMLACDSVLAAHGVTQFSTIPAAGRITVPDFTGATHKLATDLGAEFRHTCDVRIFTNLQHKKCLVILVLRSLGEPERATLRKMKEAIARHDDVAAVAHGLDFAVWFVLPQDFLTYAEANGVVTQICHENSLYINRREVTHVDQHNRLVEGAYDSIERIGPLILAGLVRT